MSTQERPAVAAQNHLIKTREETTCCIVGGGPAGAMLALLLARKGVDVTLLEEHGNFERDFRGDTVHPSTMEVLRQIGLADHVLQLEHTKAFSMVLETLQGGIMEVNFRHLKTHYPYIALIPQALFLKYLTEEASNYPHFHLLMGARAEKLLEEDGYIHGIEYRNQEGWHELRAVLTVGADGRFSRIRKLAGFESVKTSQPMDVLWLHLPHLDSDPVLAGGKLVFNDGHLFVLFDRGHEWQIGYTFFKGSFLEIKAAGIEKLRANIAEFVPMFTERLQTITEWKQVSVLSIESSRVKRWYRPGLLLIGDAAHVMTPVGGVGINYAIQDAVATANILTRGLLVGKAPTPDLARVQRRRELPTMLIQNFQRLLQKQIQQSLQTKKNDAHLPLALRLARHVPILRDAQAKFIALGPIRERVREP